MSSDFLKKLARLNAAGPFNPETGALTAAHEGAASGRMTVPAIVESPASLGGDEPDLENDEANAPTLKSLWRRAEMVRLDQSGEFIYLTLSSKGLPASLFERDGWLASMNSLKDGRWEVGLWRRALVYLAAARGDKEDGAAAFGIVSYAHTLSPGASSGKEVHPKMLDSKKIDFPIY